MFLDGDGSMSPEDISRLLRPILEDRADLVCGIRLVTRSSMPELCPYRAVRATTFDSLDLAGSRFAWAAQMLARAASRGARIVGVPVAYRERTAGRSKVGGTLRGSLVASWDIARVLLREPVRRPSQP